MSQYTRESSVWSKLMSDSSEVDSSIVVNLKNKQHVIFVTLKPTCQILYKVWFLLLDPYKG